MADDNFHYIGSIPGGPAVGSIPSPVLTAVVNGGRGAQGNTTELWFKRAAENPGAPAASPYPPTGWSQVPPATSGFLWMITGVKLATLVLSGNWSTPIRLDGVGMLVQYSVDGNTAWHDTFTTGDVFLHVKLDADVSWSGPMRMVGIQGIQGIQGEQGDQGVPGNPMRIAKVTFNGDGWPVEVPLSDSVRIPTACTLTKITLFADVAGSAVIDIWKAPLSGLPLTVANTIITAGTKPTLSNALSMEDSTLTGYTTSVAAGDVMEFVLESCTTCTKITLVLEFV